MVFRPEWQAKYRGDSGGKGGKSYQRTVCRNKKEGKWWWKIKFDFVINVCTSLVCFCLHPQVFSTIQQKLLCIKRNPKLSSRILEEKSKQKMSFYTLNIVVNLPNPSPDRKELNFLIESVQDSYQNLFFAVNVDKHRYFMLCWSLLT